SNQVWVYIPAGFTLTEVANLCMAAGVCQDGNALIGQAQQSGVLIRSGSFALPIKGDAQQILQIISTK
ncbi:MAG: hypothetical protein JWN30_370, partial [Bacilli bacterium]|nr:hypothetical protein [Bacilli bacterium]